MSIADELHYPSRWYTKLLTVILAFVFFALVSTVVISGVLTYWIVKPQRTSSEINMASFPGRPDEVDFSIAGLGSRRGWFFPGFRGAPTVVLLHGYESSRGELLTLVSALQDHQYNVFVFDFAAHGANAGVTTFGYREADEVRAAIDVLAKRNDVDAARFRNVGLQLGGVCGASGGGERSSGCRALALDAVYDYPRQMVKKSGWEKTGVGGFPFMVRSAQMCFEWMNYEHKNDPPLSANLSRMNGVPILFIEASDDPETASITGGRCSWKAPEPREEAIIAARKLCRICRTMKNASTKIGW